MNTEHPRKKPVLISTCLLGLNCRYDGKRRAHPQLDALREGFLLIPACPEQMGGLATPRPPAEIESGNGQDVLEGRSRVLDSTGNDLSENFRRGAQASLELARFHSCDTAILKERSPSCGVRQITRKEKVLDEQGVTAALLNREGILLFSDEEDDLMRRLGEN
ncbi:MAG: DUF523 domain-containing protein [Candidatus Krumholzibacteria bacterium]|jgi:uncharacterized protein YbbK (DUF523 family)|nr:DUF523 domain-containing protein [Candidatus Krumholzibacteria bacterium]MDP7021934.1 DUF523 domain-containing protein [Candidatus Krumholzibacteria bacterium]